MPGNRATTQQDTLVRNRVTSSSNFNERHALDGACPNAT